MLLSAPAVGLWARLPGVTRSAMTTFLRCSVNPSSSNLGGVRFRRTDLPGHNEKVVADAVQGNTGEQHDGRSHFNLREFPNRQ